MLTRAVKNTPQNAYKGSEKHSSKCLQGQWKTLLKMLTRAVKNTPQNAY